MSLKQQLVSTWAKAQITQVYFFNEKRVLSSYHRTGQISQVSLIIIIIIIIECVFALVTIVKFSLYFYFCISSSSMVCVVKMI